MLALLPWGDLIEDFLDGIGVSLEDFSSKMTGGWLFGYVEALRLHWVRRGQSALFTFIGGKGGIRTHVIPCRSVSYRFYNASAAVEAGDAVAPCTLLHAG